MAQADNIYDNPYADSEIDPATGLPKGQQVTLSPTSAGWDQQYDPNTGLQRQIDPTKIPGSPDYAGGWTPYQAPAASTGTTAPSSTTPVWNGAARNAFRDAWMSSAPGTDLQNFINTNPAASPYKSQFSVSGDQLRINPTVDDPYASMGQEVIDAIRDYGPGGANQPAWTGIGPGSGSAGNNVYPSGLPMPSAASPATPVAPAVNSAAPAASAAPAMSAPTVSAPTSVSAPSTLGLGTTSGQGGALFDFLMKRATQDLNIDPNSPIIKNQTDAYAAQQERTSRNYLSSVAEKQGANANIGAERRGAAEQVGQSTSAFEAQLMGQELAARRQEIQSALSGAMGLLTAEQQMQLQQELAKLTLQQQQLQFTSSQGQQESQFGRNLAQQGTQFGQNLAQQAFQFDTNSQFQNSPLYG